MYNDSFRIRYGNAPIAISENTEHYDTSPHIHREIELLVLLEGEAEVTLSHRALRLRAGEMIIVDPLEVHSVIADRRYPYHQRCICFDLSLIPDKALSEGLLSGEYSLKAHLTEDDGEATARALSSFDKLFESVKHNSEALLFESAAYVSLILAALKETGGIVTRSARGKKAAFPRRVQEYLSENYMKNLTSEDVARELYYNQSYFCRLFKSHFGTSFLEYLSMYRISLAKTMLENPSAKVSEVSEAVGFMDSAYFSRCFKRLVGISPSEYKKYQYSY